MEDKQFENYLAEEVKRIRGIYYPTKAGFLRQTCWYHLLNHGEALLEIISRKNEISRGLGLISVCDRECG